MSESLRHILVTGANGFIGKNIVVALNELPSNVVTSFIRSDDVAELPTLIARVDAVIHLAGENRPADEDAFSQINVGLTAKLCECIRQEYSINHRHVPLLLASSIQVERDTSYGRSKREAELLVQALAKETGNPCVIFRLPGVFGKWCKPNYNSVVATFCYNIARNLPINIEDPYINLRLAYVDDVVKSMLIALDNPVPGCAHVKVDPEYTVSLGELAEKINAFSNSRFSLVTERVGTGLLRALYATYVSYLPHKNFSYEVTRHADSRGVFVEMLKTFDSGQVSYFTAHPGITRGGHYHHTKSEKFLVVKGEALFRFRHLLTNELIELRTSDVKSQIVDSIPGWSHDITNIGSDEMIVMLWANENFDQQKPDTVISKV